MNLGEIRTLVRTNIDEITPGFWTEAQITRYINVANQKVNSIIDAMDGDFFTVRVVFSTVALTRTYELPTTFREMVRLEHYSLTDQNDIQVLEELPFPRTEGAGEYPFSQAGKPGRYTLHGTVYDLLPIPDAVYPMRMFFKERQLDMSNETAHAPASPLEFHDMVAIYATIQALQKNHEDASAFSAIWADRKEDLIMAMSSGRKGQDPEYVEGFMEDY